MKIERSDYNYIYVKDGKGRTSSSDSVEANLLYEILQELKNLNKEMTDVADTVRKIL